MLQDYEYSPTATFEDISVYFDVPLSEIYRVNNIPDPYPLSTDVVADTENETGLSGIIKVPMIQNGNESVENDSIDTYAELTEIGTTIPGSGFDASFKIGYASQYKCWIQIEGDTYYFPCYPETYSDSRSAHFTQQTPLGRSEPFQIYQNSGPRVVNASFQMHVEMTHATPIRDLVAAVQSAEYPLGLSRSDTIVPRVIFKIGDSCYIEGIIADQVTADWSGPLIDNRYVMVTLSFSVTECTGMPRTAEMVRNNWAR